MKTPRSLAFALVALSTFAYADTQADKKPTENASGTQKPRATSDVYLANPRQTFEFWGTALLLQPTAGDLHYAAEAVPLPAVSPHWKIQDIETDYSWGFDLGLRGVFHNSNTNMMLNWEHFHSTDSSSKTVSSENMIGPFFEIGPDALPYKKAKGEVEFHFDEVNLDYGILVKFGNRLLTNLFSGVGFTRIKQTTESRFSNLEGTIVKTIETPSSFIGAGPQFGSSFSYRIAKGFHFTGRGFGTLLVGRQSTDTSFSSTSPGLAAFGASSPNKQKTEVHDRTQVVPGLEGKLGFAYQFNCYRDTLVKLEVGYQAQIYINALRSVDIGSEVVTPPVTPDTVGVFARTFDQSTNNFALAGPYFTLMIGF